MNQITTNSLPKELEDKIIRSIELKKQLEQFESDLKAELKEAMEQNGIYSIKNDSYQVTLATRTNYKAVDEVDEKYLKQVLDTTKVSAEVTLTGELPEGVEESKTNYITWRTK